MFLSDSDATSINKYRRARGFSWTNWGNKQHAILTTVWLVESVVCALILKNSWPYANTYLSISQKCFSNSLGPLHLRYHKAIMTSWLLLSPLLLKLAQTPLTKTVNLGHSSSNDEIINPYFMEKSISLDDIKTTGQLCWVSQ